MSETSEVIGVGRKFSTGNAAQKVWRLLRNPGRLVSFLQRKRGYKQGWDHLGSDQVSAYAMVDSSTDEAEFRRRGQAVATLLADVLLLQGTESVLEIGCGPARIGRELAPRCGRWIGADISAQMVKRARTRTSHLPNVSFTVLDGARLAEIGDASLDRVYCHSVLVHIDKEDLFKYLCEIARVLKPGGLAYFDTWNILHEDAWRWFADSAREAPLAGRKVAWRPQFATTPELRRFVEKAGLTEILIDDASHLLQAFATVAPPGEDASKLVERHRAALSGHVAKIRGFD